MSALTERIAAEIIKHHPIEDSWYYQCNGDDCTHGEDTAARWAAHVAEQLEAELHIEVVLVKEGEVPPLYAISGWVCGGAL